MQKLFSLGNEVKMTELEKNKIRHNLAVHIQKNPVRTPSIYFFRSITVGVFAVLLFIASGTSMVASAQKSLPGQFLYPVKRASESVKKITLSTSTEKTNYELELIEKRFAEANTLLQEKKYNPEIETIIAKSIKSHSETLEKETVKLASINPSQALTVNTKLQNLLETKSNELMAVATVSETTETESEETPETTRPTILALATFEASQKITEKKKQIEEIVLVDATSSTQSTAEEKFANILALAEMNTDLFIAEKVQKISPASLTAKIATSATLDTLRTTALVTLTSATVSTSGTSIPLIPLQPPQKITYTLPELLEQIKQARENNQYGKIILLANEIETTVKKILEQKSQEKIEQEKTLEQIEVKEETPVKTKDLTEVKSEIPLKTKELTTQLKKVE